MDERWTRRAAAGGFTLVELLVAMAITAMVSVAILTLMDSTSDSMHMAESSAETLDQTRFALERVKSQLRNAAAYGSVDSRDDPRYRPQGNYISERNAAGDDLDGVLYEGNWTNDGCGASIGNTARRLAGLVSYSGWQDYAGSVMTSAHQTAHSDGDTLQTQFDGIVTVGAYDYPTPFAIRIYDKGNPIKVKVPASPRGTYRLANPNPFDTSTSTPGNFPDSDLNDSTNRVLRIMDHHGKFQFSAINDAKFGSPDTNELRLNLVDGHRPYFQDKSESYGLQPCSQQTGDVTYRAALLDAYWLRVRQDPNDARNYQLVRTRLDAGTLVETLTTSDEGEHSWDNWDPSTMTVGSPAVIADRVVDFQIWFDCATNGSDGSITGGWWPSGWRIVDNNGNTIGNTSNEPTNCLNPDDPDPARARAVHVRLATRTEGERGGLAHSMFQEGRSETLQTFDLYPEHRGAAAVETTQVDFELPNYAAHNITQTASAN